MTGVWLLLAVLACATVFGVWRQRTDGRMRTVGEAESADRTDSSGRDGASPAASLPAVSDRSGVSVGDSDPGNSDPGNPDPDDISDAEDASEPLVVGGAELGPADHSVIPAAHVLTGADVGAALGERATLVQFSSAFCQPCRATRVVLGDVARAVPGVAHVEIDAESHLDLVRRVDVTRTPTVLVLDASGRIRSRATGAPRSADVIAALGALI